MNKILEIKNLTKYYGQTKGIENLNLDLCEGEIFGFIGPNGAGKSTTIRSIMNLINKTSGEVLFMGKPLDKNDKETKKLIGYLPSEIHLYDDLKVSEILTYHQCFFEEDLKEYTHYLVELFELDTTKKIEDLSLGNLKKVGIILALMHHPKLLILDEPTSGLDPIMQKKFYDLLLEEKKKNTTIIYSTHILSEVNKICDRVGIIKKGELIKIESVENLQNKNYEYVTIKSKDIESIEKELNLEAISKQEDTIKFKNTLSHDTLIKKLAQFTIDKLLIEEMDLEDIFFHYYN